MSSLLFAISIEPLAQLIQDDRTVKGITIRGGEYKLSLTEPEPTKVVVGSSIHTKSW